ncbi:MAG TPA: 6-hydroxymethylpterin diphosphokinase MptE-like protein, partial [Spirochaetia bacterium]
MSLVEENLRVLAARYPSIAALVEDRVGAGPGLEIAAARSGDPTARLDGIHLHSRYDPARDAEQQVAREIDPACTAIICIGFGLGYGPQAARRRFPDRPLLVVEPAPDVFAAALACRDLRPLISDPGVELYVAAHPEGVARLLEGLPLARPAWLRLRPGFQARPAEYRAAEETLHSWSLRRDININTLRRFGRLWVRNLCRNARELAERPGVATLAGAFDGIPALVVAGGPTLDDVAPRLPALRERMLVISVNTPLRPCIARGCPPDFAVVVDPQYWASRFLDWTALPRGAIVAEPSTCPRAFRATEATFFLCGSLFPLGETLERSVGEKGALGAGGSVATSAWDLGRLLGARPLYSAGLDLGFPGHRTHCRGVYTEEMWLSAAGRLAPAEGSAFRSLRDIGLFEVRATGGGTVPTDRRMLLYKWWFENQLRMRPDLEAFTLSPRGVAIEGMPPADI